MSIFDGELPQAYSKPESFENESHAILKYPAIEIDLDQPNRADDEEVAEQLGEGAKLVAEIKTPKHEIGIFYTKVPDYQPIVVIADGENPALSRTLIAGEDVDISDNDGEGKCIITFDTYGRILVNAEHVDTDYKIYTRELVQYRDPAADHQDDPEY